MDVSGKEPRQEASTGGGGTFGKYLQGTLKSIFGKKSSDDSDSKSTHAKPVTKQDAKPPTSGSGTASASPHKSDDKSKHEKPQKWISAGGVVVFSTTDEGLKKILLVSPKGKYGGYTWTFPKGRVDEGENLIKTAKREVREESGIEASLLPGGYLGVEEGTSSFTHYYMMIRVSGEPGGAGSDGESEKVEWVSWSDAFDRMKGSSRDRTVLLRAWSYVRKLRKQLG